MLKNKKVQYVFIVFISVLYLFIAYKSAHKNDIDYSMPVYSSAYSAKVVEMVDENYQKTVYPNNENMDVRYILVTAKFTSGYKKGTTTTVIQSLSSTNLSHNQPLKIGDKIVVVENPDPATSEIKYMFGEYLRSNIMIGMAIVFAILLIIFGRMKGFNTLISLALTITSIFFVYIPAVLNGGNPYTWAIAISIYIIFMTLLIINGFSKKSLASIIGCSCGVATSGILTVIFSNVLHITGFTTSESMFLASINPNSPIDLKGIIFATITFGAIGAIMDVSMSLASALYELKETAPDILAKDITKSGFVIGRDMMGTMANTLILAYIGSSLTITMLIIAYNDLPIVMFNSERVVVEILQALTGSFGILLTIPLTSIICGIIYTNIKNKDSN